VKLKGGKWFYEVKLVTYGKIHIGFVSEKCNIPTNTNTGIGHDTESWSYDGNYQSAWHGGTEQKRYGEYWNSNDIIGVVLDCDAKTISYYRNGKELGIAHSNVTIGDGLYPAASLMYAQKIQFNFGSTQFKYNLTEIYPDIHPIHVNLTKEQHIQLTKLYEQYKGLGINLSQSGESDDVIKANGLLQFTQDLGIVDDKDPALLVVVWKLNAKDKKVWEISRESFIGGWSLEGCFSIDGMKKKLKQWKEEIKTQAKFKLFYNFVFDYLKEDKTILPMEEATTVWEMLGFNQKWPIMSQWLEYCQGKKSITRDTWRMFYNFTEQHPKDLQNFNGDDSSWPIMIDEFVEFMKKEKVNKL